MGRWRFILLCLLFLVVTPSQAFFAEPIKIDNELQKVELSQSLYFQLTDSSVQFDDLTSDPTLHQQFNQIKSSKIIEQKNTNQALWIFFRLTYKGKRSLHTVLHYNYPLTDKIEFFVYSRASKNLIFQQILGAQLPFFERKQLSRSYAFPFEIQPQQELDVYLKITNAALPPVNLTLWQDNLFRFDQLTEIILDSVLSGVLLLMAIYTLILYFHYQQPFFVALTCTFFLTSLSFCVLNGLGLAFLWPHSPAINQAMVYVATGGVLSFLTLFNGTLVKASISLLKKSGYILCLFVALALTFSPLYLPEIHRLNFLILCLLICVCLNAALLLQDSLIRTQQMRLVGLSFLVFLSTFSLYTCSKIGLFDIELHWQILLLLCITCSIILLTYRLAIIERNLEIEPKTSSELNRLRIYEQLYSQATEGMFTTTLKGRIVHANQALLDMLGYSNFKQMKADVARSGMSRYYADPASRQQLLSQLKIDEYVTKTLRGLRADGTPFWMKISVRSRKYMPNHGFDRFLDGSIQDITHNLATEEQLAYLATHDPLTSHFNREFLVKALDDQLATANDAYLLHLDFAKFRFINSSCNHSAGDALLKQFSHKLQLIVDARGLFARLESDKFAIALIDNTESQALDLARELLIAVKQFHFVWQDKSFTVGLHIGIASKLSLESHPEQWLKRAEIACALAKLKGPNSIYLYNENDADLQNYLQEIIWQHELNQAIEKESFVFYQQSIVSFRNTSQGAHYELLLLLKQSNGELLSADEFMTRAERFNLITQIDRWVLRNYFSWLSKHPQHLENLYLCHINLSTNSLSDPTFQSYTEAMFTRYRIPHEKICFEMTESTVIANRAQTLEFISKFKQLGCKFTLDKFGSGLSSYTYIKDFPIDFIKIDGQFTRDLLNAPFDKAIVRSIQVMSQEMNLEAIAQFVQNYEISNELKKIGISFGQGDELGAAKPLAVVE